MKFYISILLLFTINKSVAQVVIATSKSNLKIAHSANVPADKKIPNVPSKNSLYINRLNAMKGLNLNVHKNTVPHSTNVPIKDGLIYLLFAGTGLAFYMFYKYEQKVTPTEN